MIQNMANSKATGKPTKDELTLKYEKLLPLECSQWVINKIEII